MPTGFIELVFMVTSVVAVATWIARARRQADSGHHARAHAMGGRVASSPGEREVSRYEGTADGIEWTLSVVTIDDAETPRRTTLIWRTRSVRSDRVLTVVGNDIRGDAGSGRLAIPGYPLGLDPAADRSEQVERTGQPPPIVSFALSAHEVTPVLHGLPDGFRAFADDDAVAREILSRETIAAISRWHAAHGGALRIWTGGPDVRLMVAQIHWPPPDAFADLLTLGLRLARDVAAVTAGTVARHRN